jgi:hypothetical protein
VARAGLPASVVVVGAGVQLLAWLLIRPDRSGVAWAYEVEFRVWVTVEAVLAAAIGVSGADRRTVSWAVLAGWLAQVLHFAAWGEHHPDPVYGADPLWAVGVVIQLALALVAAAIALVTSVLASARRRRSPS